MLGRARHGRRVRGRADIDREDVIRYGRPPAAEDALAREIDARDFVLIKPGAREAAERAAVDVRFVEAVMARHKPGEHARIGRVDLARDQGEPHAFEGLHAEAPKDLHMRMPGADEHHVLDDWPGRPLHRVARAGGTTSSGARDRRVGKVSTRSQRLRRLENMSMVMESVAVARIRTTATSSRSSEMAAST